MVLPQSSMGKYAGREFVRTPGCAAFHSPMARSTPPGSEKQAASRAATTPSARDGPIASHSTNAMPLTAMAEQPSPISRPLPQPGGAAA